MDMLEWTHLDKSYFNHQFLKFRIHYYFHETKELLARHKLLAAFIICLLAPGVKNIRAIGIPFFALIDPITTVKTKLIYLVSLVFFLMAMTKAQLPFIKGGIFRDYLHTLYIPWYVHKAIDFIILLVSLNIVWLAICFGAVSIFYHAEDSLFLSSQYCLYLSIVFALGSLLLNFLYKKISNGLVIFSALTLTVFISKQSNCLLNYGAAIGISLLCGFIIWITQPNQTKQKYPFKIPSIILFDDLQSFHFLKNIFIIQLAVLRKNKLSFLIRFTICFVLSALILQVLSSPETVANRQGIILVLINLQTYILSTLFTFFEKEKLEHSLFHRIFPYQRYIQSIKEITFSGAGLMMTLAPIFLFYNFSLTNFFSLILLIYLMNAVVLAVNRVLYTQSLRFCLFSSLLNTVASSVVQYIFLDVYYD